MKTIVVLISLLYISSLEACLDKSTKIQVQTVDMPTYLYSSDYSTSPYSQYPEEYTETECCCVTKTSPRGGSDVPVSTCNVQGTNCVPSQRSSATNCGSSTQCSTIPSYSSASSSSISSPCSCSCYSYAPSSPSSVSSQCSGLSNLVPLLFPENVLYSDPCSGGKFNTGSYGTLDPDFVRFGSQQSNFASGTGQYGNAYYAFC